MDDDSDVFRDDDSSVASSISGAGFGEQGDDNNNGGQELEESASQLIPSPYEQLMLSPNIVFDTIVTGHVGTLSYILDDVIVFARDRHNEFDMSHVIPELPTNFKVTQLMFPNRVLSAPVIRPDLLKAFVVNNEPLAIDDADDDAVHNSIISPGSTVTLPKVSLPVRIFVHRIHERLDMEGADIVRCFPTVFRNLAELPTGTLKQVFRFELMSGVKNRSAATNLHFLFLAYKMTLTEEIDDALEKLKRKGLVTSKRGALRDYDRTFPRTQVFINTHLSIRNGPLYWSRYRGKVHMMAKEFGQPHVYLTFSLNWRNLEECARQIYDQLKDHMYFSFFGRSFQQLDWIHKSALLSSDPVLVAKYFDTRCKAMMRLMNTHRTTWGRNNEIVHFVTRTEQTRRGNPHMHMLACIKSIPRQEAIHHNHHHPDNNQRQHRRPMGELMRVCAEFITTEHTAFQVHSHNIHCGWAANEGFMSCKKGFPRIPIRLAMYVRPFAQKNNIIAVNIIPPTASPAHDDDATPPPPPSPPVVVVGENTQPPENIDHFRQVLSDMKSWLARHYDTRVGATTTFDAFLAQFGVSDDEYENVILRLSVADFGRVLPARLVANVMVNDYNQVLADAWKGHMDMQIVVDSSRLIDYVGKAPDHVASKQLLAVAQAQGRTFPPLRYLVDLKDMRDTETVSAVEAAFIALSMPLFKTSIGDVFMSTQSKEFRRGFRKSKAELEQLPEDSRQVLVQ
ncbi:unnamed protein product [Allacma fusca]|uniref:Helitron helicase-like domain-containing protein n=1 Tax=Allacma fusca TaxID=39272 RepID=A0A8J2JBS6_9HEXA|nr:unnamed protein product [Allacma fusca]